MKTKVRKKPCRHCLFTKNFLGEGADIEYQRSVAVSRNRMFPCHEHSCNEIVCHGAYRRVPDRLESSEIEFINYNGDLKHEFCQMTKEQRSKYRVKGS